MLSVAGNRRLEQCTDLGLHAARAVVSPGSGSFAARHATRHLKGGTKEAIAPPFVTHSRSFPPNDHQPRHGG